MGVSEFFLFVGGGGGQGVVLLKCLPKKVDPRAILPLGLLHSDLVCWHPGSSYTAIGGAHQSDFNPTLDIPTRLQVVLIPLGGQANGYPLQGSRCLHVKLQILIFLVWVGINSKNFFISMMI